MSEDVTLHTGACRSTTIAALANFVAEQIDATPTTSERDELSTLWDNLTTVVVRRCGLDYMATHCAHPAQLYA